MNRLLSILLATALICVVFAPTTTFAQGSISVDHVDGLILGKAQPDVPLKLHLRFTNNAGYNIAGQSIGFKIYLTNNGELLNGTYETPYFSDLLPEIPNLFDLVFHINYFGADGVGSDTLAIGGSQLFNGGWADGYDKVIANISTSVFSEHAGDSLCIDSTFYPPSGAWLWASSNGSFAPDWGGPYCYEILPSCCVGMRGNYSNSSDDQIDISDLVQMVSFMFLMGTAPVCDEEADFNGDGILDIADLVALVAYMHLGGDPPANCQ